MSEVIRIKKGLDINLKGKANEVFSKAQMPDVFSVRPDDFHGIKPKTIVKDGDSVKVGSVLFYDKANPDLKAKSILYKSATSSKTTISQSKYNTLLY